MTPLEKLLEKLPDARRSGAGWAARCPAHDDKAPSLSISEGDDGRALVHCHSGCEPSAIMAALGLTMADLMPNNGDRVQKTPTKATKPTTIYPTANEAVKALESYLGKRSMTWTYHDAGGEPMGLILRWNLPGGKKDIRPVSKNCQGWIVGGMSEPRPLYNLPELKDAQRVYIPEGEKCCDSLRSIGLKATTSPHGSKSPGKADWRSLAGREVILLPDNDAPGESYINAVGGLLAKLNPAPTVKVLRLPGLSEGGDIFDYLLKNPDSPEVMQERIENMADASEPWEPATTDKGDTTKAVKPVKRFEPFPVDVLPWPINDFVSEGAKAIGCDAANLVIPLLTAMAAAIGNTRRLLIKRGWSVPSILWSMIIGESGSHKTPAIKTVMRPIYQRAEIAARRYEEEAKNHETELAMHEKYMAEWKRDKKTCEPPPDKPEPPKAERLVISDATVEAVAPILLANPRGVLLARDELAGWLGSFDRYASRGGGDAAIWLSMYSGETVIVDRKSGLPKTIRVPNASVSILGGIQPGTLQRSMDIENRERGLLARFLLTCPPRKPRRLTADEIDPATTAAIAEVFDVLYMLQPESDEDGNLRAGLVKLSGDAWNLFETFVKVNGDELLDLQGDLAAAWSKLEEIPARLALVIHYVRLAAGDYGTGGPDVVDAATMAAAIRLTEWFKGETLRVYGLMGESDRTADARRLAEWVERRGGTATAREVQQGHRQYKTADDATAALDGLVKAGLGRWETVSPATKGGRSFSRFILSTVSTVYGTPLKPEENEGCVDVDSVDASETQPPESDEWWEV